jgi:hypothetical protein
MAMVGQVIVEDLADADEDAGEVERKQDGEGPDDVPVEIGPVAGDVL